MFYHISPIYKIRVWNVVKSDKSTLNHSSALNPGCFNQLFESYIPIPQFLKPVKKLIENAQSKRQCKLIEIGPVIF